MVMINSAKGSLQKKKLGHLKVNFFYVYFAFQTILSILIFHENVPFFGRLGLGIGVPPLSLKLCLKFGFGKTLNHERGLLTELTRLRQGSVNKYELFTCADSPTFKVPCHRKSSRTLNAVFSKKK